MNCNHIAKIYEKLRSVERDRLQGQSVTTAYLTDTVLSIVHSLYGKNGGKYKSNPQQFLPGYKPQEEKHQGVHKINQQTIDIVIAEYDLNRIPEFARTHLSQQITRWEEKNED